MDKGKFLKAKQNKRSQTTGCIEINERKSINSWKWTIRKTNAGRYPDLEKRDIQHQRCRIIFGTNSNNIRKIINEMVLSCLAAIIPLVDLEKMECSCGGFLFFNIQRKTTHEIAACHVLVRNAIFSSKIIFCWFQVIHSA